MDFFKKRVFGQADLEAVEEKRRLAKEAEDAELREIFARAEARRRYYEQPERAQDYWKHSHTHMVANYERTLAGRDGRQPKNMLDSEHRLDSWDTVLDFYDRAEVKFARMEEKRRNESKQ